MTTPASHDASRAIQLVRPPDAPEAPNLMLAYTGLLVALLLVAAAVVLWRRSTPEAPADEAFRRLARASGLGRADRELVRRLAAAHGAAAPVALLLSEHAYRAAMDALWRTVEDAAVRADAGRLLNRLHGGA